MSARILPGIVFAAYGIFYFINTYKKSKKIDTESIAVVKDVQYLGMAGIEKVYAVKYDVNCSEPFELVETPCKKGKKIGLTRGVFYESDNPKQNYYFKTIGRFDKRLLLPTLITLIGVSASIISAFGIG